MTLCKIWQCAGRAETARKKKVKERLPLTQKFAHGVGHIYNDLGANAWFSYLIIFLTRVSGLSSASAGLVVLVGQITDGVCTPFTGLLNDRTVSRYGRRKVWHLIGTVCSTISFPLLLSRCIGCVDSSPGVKLIYYCACAVVFQFGWGCVQVSHLSLIPEISRSAGERVELNAIRSALTFLCGIYVYGVTWILLGQSEEVTLSPNVWKQFMYLGFIVVGTGTVFNIIFHVGTKEPPSQALIKWKQKKKERELEKEKSEMKSLLEVTWRPDSSRKQNSASPYVVTSISKKSGKTTNRDTKYQEQKLEKNRSFEIIEKMGAGNNRERTWKRWLTEPGFYKVGFVYTCSRLVVNISQSYLPLYLTETLHFEKEAIAYFPLVVLVTGVVASTGVKLLNKKLGSKLTFCFGSTLALGACIWFFLQSIEGRNAVYVPAVLMGCGGSIMLVTSLSLIAELIGNDQKSGAFVYGAISFTDKLSSGAVIAIIQEMNPRTNMTTECEACDIFLRNVQSFAPGAAAGIALLLIILFFDSGFTCKKKVERREIAVQTNLDDEASEHEDDSTVDSFPDMSDEADAAEEAESLGSSREENTYISFETKNLLLLPRAMENCAAMRLASPFVPSPMLGRRAGRK